MDRDHSSQTIGYVRRKHDLLMVIEADILEEVHDGRPSVGDYIMPSSPTRSRRFCLPLLSIFRIRTDRD